MWAVVVVAQLVERSLPIQSTAVRTQSLAEIDAEHVFTINC